MQELEINKKAFMDSIDGLYLNSVYYADKMSQMLRDCGFKSHCSEDGQTLFVEGEPVNVTEPEWGQPGILPIQIVYVVYKLTVGEEPGPSNYTGRGFQYQELKDKLKAKWGMI